MTAPGSGNPACCWGLDLGATKLAAVVLAAPLRGTPADAILARYEWPIAGQDLQALLAAGAGELAARHGPPTSVGLAVAAAVDDHGHVGSSPNLRAPAGPILGQWLARASGCARPLLMNDANAFLHGELQAAGTAPPACAVGVVLGTGAGAAIAFQGQVRVGPSGTAGEWGHLPPPREDDEAALELACGCGRRGCIDALLGGPGWLWTARRRGLAVESPEAAVAALQAGNLRALAAARDYRDRLARALSLWMDLLDPDLLLLGGGLAAVPELFEDLEASVAEARHGTAFTPHIVTGRLGRHGAALGAAVAAAEAMSQSM
jgi:fructokinase